VHDNGTDAIDGETGEILVQSPSATSGYWNAEAATAELFRDGWLQTGDLGRRDEDGYFWFVGRKKLMIVRRGSNIAPAEIEDVLDEHPKVHASVVVGIPDRADGHVPVACITPLAVEDPPTEEELREFLSGQIAEYKIPVRFLIMPELPRNSTGKADRHRLEEMASAAVKC
jgi:long-chain acyl-CoA synthetase